MTVAIVGCDNAKCVIPGGQLRFNFGQHCAPSSGR